MYSQVLPETYSYILCTPRSALDRRIVISLCKLAFRDRSSVDMAHPPRLLHKDVPEISRACSVMSVSRADNTTSYHRNRENSRPTELIPLENYLEIGNGLPNRKKMFRGTIWAGNGN